MTSGSQGTDSIPDGHTILAARSLTKFYGSVRALESVDFDLVKGEVLAIVGDNGAGKSTLMKALVGALIPDHGQVWVDGQEVKLHSPRDAQARGIAAVYQDLALVDQRDVPANIFLGQERVGLFNVVQRGQMVRESKELLTSLKIELTSLRTLAGMLSGGQRQVIAIARAVGQGGRIVVMDEPTAALGIQESAMVLNLIQRLASSGVSVVVISHNLQHVRAVADRVSVMRQGRVVGVRKTRETDDAEIVSMIVGTASGTIQPAAQLPEGSSDLN